MRKTVSIGGHPVGDGHHVFIITEAGINHNGDLDIARQLIDAAKTAGCNAVTFQKRTPELCIPLVQRDVPHQMPWGRIPYMEYGRRLEFGDDEHRLTDRHCREAGIPWCATSA